MEGQLPSPFHGFLQFLYLDCIVILFSRARYSRSPVRRYRLCLTHLSFCIVPNWNAGDGTALLKNLQNVICDIGLCFLLLFCCVMALSKSSDCRRAASNDSLSLEYGMCQGKLDNTTQNSILKYGTRDLGKTGKPWCRTSRTSQYNKTWVFNLVFRY